MDSMQKAIAETLAPMSAKEARDAINNGSIHIPETYRDFAWGIVAAKEADERAVLDAENLTISRKALQASEDANSIALKARSDARLANKIAISAMILSIATAIGIAIFQWLTNN